jgi:hypothetical protein
MVAISIFDADLGGVGMEASYLICGFQHFL